MVEQTGSTYQAAQFAKAMVAGEYKSYKTVSLIAWALGLFPWQKNGGVVDKPENLHVVTMDAGAVRGVKSFLKNVLQAPDSALNFRVWNFEDDARRVYESEKPYDHSLYQSVLALQQRLREETDRGGVPLVLFSSLTVLAMALERAIMGPPIGAGKSGKGIGDEDRWGLLKRQLFTIQNAFNVDQWHMFWEAHVLKGTEDGKETLQISGSAGRNWGVNMEQIFRLQRGQRINLDDKRWLEQVHLDCRPSTEFIAGGKNFSELLNAQEPDLTVALYKLGLKVGQWNRPEKKG